MATPRLTNILIGVMFIALIVSGITTFLVGVSGSYAANNIGDVEDEYLQVFLDESQQTINRLERSREDIDTIEEDRNVLDRLASFFRSGYDATRSLIGGVDSITRLINSSVSRIPFLGEFGGLLSVTLGIIVLIVFLGIFIHFLIKSDRI